MFFPLYSAFVSHIHSNCFLHCCCLESTTEETCFSSGGQLFVFLVPTILLYELLYYSLYRPEVNGKWFKVHELNINLGYVQPLSLRATEHAIQNAALWDCLCFRIARGENQLQYLWAVCVEGTESFFDIGERCLHWRTLDWNGCFAFQRAKSFLLNIQLLC